MREKHFIPDNKELLSIHKELLEVLKKTNLTNSFTRQIVWNTPTDPREKVILKADLEFFLSLEDRQQLSLNLKKFDQIELNVQIKIPPIAVNIDE